MIPTVDEVVDEIQSLLGDVEGRVFDDTLCLLGYKRAYRRLREQLIKDQIPGIVSVVTYTLAAGTTSLTPATAGISNFGELVMVEERTPGTTEDFVEVIEVGALTNGEQMSALSVYEWRGEAFYFYGSFNSRELRIRYYDSGVPPESGSVGIDGSLDFLSHFGAASVGPSRGYAAVQELKADALGPRLDGNGGMLFDLIQPMVRSLQRVQRQPKPYGVDRQYSWRRARRPLYIAAPPADSGVIQEFTISGTQDGVNATFTLSQNPQSLQLFNNGILQYEDVAYTRAGTVVTFLTGYIPASTDLLHAEGVV